MSPHRVRQLPVHEYAQVVYQRNNGTVLANRAAFLAMYQYSCATAPFAQLHFLKSLPL
ncbi:hypothetical protein [Nostoc sp. CALU 546]|uniref:hypothetical protein n=1 Tax=Nostoc sp. CALU 546 TaxID=1867241 RepID=UPI003B66C8F6